ncbi:MAG: CPBP family intramembrane metalloprotease [Chloroflexi bacterium]|nr:MAG: CPBP family intramembrane metalloprotease [Chloroflexota bacterium]
MGRRRSIRVRRRASRSRQGRASLRVRHAGRRRDLRRARGDRAPPRSWRRDGPPTAHGAIATARRWCGRAKLDGALPDERARADGDRHARASRAAARCRHAARRGCDHRLTPWTHPAVTALLQHRRRNGSRARAPRSAARAAGDRLTHHGRRLAAWAAVVLVLASLSYGARLTSNAVARPDTLFRWSIAIETLAIDGIILAVVLLIARGLPLREAFALRAPTSWAAAGRIALAALGATWLTSAVLEALIGHAAREQAVPQYWDETRAAPYLVNAIVIAGFVPIVEESMCRGLGFVLLARWGERVAVLGSAVAFALAHGAVTDFPWVLVTGVGLGYLRARTWSLYPCVALHGTINGIAVLVSALAGATGVT